MNQYHLRTAALALCAAALLTACGSGGDDNGGGGTGFASPGSSVPSSALSSIEGLNAYLKNLIASMTDETSEPVALGDITLPTSETSEPLNVN